MYMGDRIIWRGPHLLQTFLPCLGTRLVKSCPSSAVEPRETRQSLSCLSDFPTCSCHYLQQLGVPGDGGPGPPHFVRQDQRCAHDSSELCLNTEIIQEREHPWQIKHIQIWEHCLPAL